MGIPEGGEWFFGDSAMAIDRAATGQTRRTKGLVMGWRRGDNNGRIARRWSGDGAIRTDERLLGRRRVSVAYGYGSAARGNLHNSMVYT